MSYNKLVEAGKFHSVAVCVRKEADAAARQLAGRRKRRMTERRREAESQAARDEQEQEENLHVEKQVLGKIGGRKSASAVVREDTSREISPVATLRVREQFTTEDDNSSIGGTTTVENQSDLEEEEQEHEQEKHEVNSVVRVTKEYTMDSADLTPGNEVSSRGDNSELSTESESDDDRDDQRNSEGGDASNDDGKGGSLKASDADDNKLSENSQSGTIDLRKANIPLFIQLGVDRDLDSDDDSQNDDNEAFGQNSEENIKLMMDGVEVGLYVWGYGSMGKFLRNSFDLTK